VQFWTFCSTPAAIRGDVFFCLRFFGVRGAYGRVAARRSSGRPSVKASCNSSGGSGDASVRCLRGGGLGGATHNRNTQFDFSCLLSWRGETLSPLRSSPLAGEPLSPLAQTFSAAPLWVWAMQ
jgi:hypothetical protein